MIHVNAWLARLPLEQPPENEMLCPFSKWSPAFALDLATGTAKPGDIPSTDVEVVEEPASPHPSDISEDYVRREADRKALTADTPSPPDDSSTRQMVARSPSPGICPNSTVVEAVHFGSQQKSRSDSK